MKKIINIINGILLMLMINLLFWISLSTVFSWALAYRYNDEKALEISLTVSCILSTIFISSMLINTLILGIKDLIWIVAYIRIKKYLVKSSNN